MAKMAVFVVLLRAIGPITHRLMSMAQWRDAALADGFINPQTYVATGNMIAVSDRTSEEVTSRMDAIVRRLGLGPGNKAVVRTADELQNLLRAAPFPDAIADLPSEVSVYFFAGQRPDFDWVGDYNGPERIHIEGSHLMIDYAGRGPTSRLPAVVEKRSGVVTARNWNTLRGLVERANARMLRG